MKYVSEHDFEDEFGSVWREAAISSLKMWTNRGNSQNTSVGLLAKNEPWPSQI
jgi:hypothetical protein